MPKGLSFIDPQILIPVWTKERVKIMTEAGKKCAWTFVPLNAGSFFLIWFFLHKSGNCVFGSGTIWCCYRTIFGWTLCLRNTKNKHHSNDTLLSGFISCSHKIQTKESMGLIPCVLRAECVLVIDQSATSWELNTCHSSFLGNPKGNIKQNNRTKGLLRTIGVPFHCQSDINL